MWCCFAVLELQVHAVEAVLPELCERFIIKPVSPVLLEVVDWVICIRLFKRLDVDWPSVVVALRGNDGDVGPLKLVFDHLRGLDCQVSYIIFSHVPDVVR